MEAATLGRIVGELQGEEARLLERRQELAQALDELDKELHRVQAGVHALTGKAATKGKSTKPSPNKDVVRDAVRQCLENGARLDADALKSAVAVKVKAVGYSCVGMALRLKEVLEEDYFEECDGGYRLAGHAQEGRGHSIG